MTDRTFYDDWYDHDPAAENPAGREDLREIIAGEPEPRTALQAHVRSGQSILTFVRATATPEGSARMLAAMDRAISKITPTKFERAAE